MQNKVRDLLKERGITQKELAKGIGMSEIGLSKALDGSATKATLDRIAEYLKVETESLIAESKPLKAKYGSDKTPLKFGELEIPCYVLENGMRVLSGRGIQRAIGSTSQSGAWLSRFINNGTISDTFSAGENSITERVNNPISFVRNNAGGSQSATNGYEATLLIDICSAIIDENRAGNFDDANIVRCADMIIRSVAKVGIIALIDEATGYAKAKNRAKDELQKILSSLLKEEAGKWVKTFPDAFFEMIYKMNNWTWTGAAQRPGVIGKWINDIVYERIAPKLLHELRRLNPKNESGNRAKKHFQYLTEEVGHPKLLQHIEGVMAIGRLSGNNWPKFMRNLDKAYPKYYSQLEFDFDEDED